MPARRGRNGGAYTIFAAEPRSYSPDHWPRVHAPSKPLTRRLAFWSVAVSPLLLIVFLGCYLDGAAPAVADALLHSIFAPLLVFALRAVTLIYFLPLALRGVSPSPVFAGVVVYLVAGLALLGWRKWKRAAIVLLLPLLCTIPLSVIGLRTADGQADTVKGAFYRAMTARDVAGVTEIDYRFVVFDASGSKVTVASVVTTRDTWENLSPEGTWKYYRSEFKEDYAAQMVKQSSGQWRVASLKTDFHPGYEP